MKNAKKILALLLAVCMLIGLPMAVQANDSADEELKLLYATRVPDIMARRTDAATADRAIALYFNKCVTWGSNLRIRVVGYDKDGNVVRVKFPDATAAEACDIGLNLNATYTMANPIVLNIPAANRNFDAMTDNAQTPIDHFCVFIGDDSDHSGSSAATKNDGKIAGITVDGTPITATHQMKTSRTGNSVYDALLVEVEEKEDVLVMNSVEILNDRQVHVGFSEAVTINMDDIGSKYAARFGVAKRVYNGTSRSYDYTMQPNSYKTVNNTMVTLDEDGKGLTAQFAEGAIHAVLDTLYSTRNGDSGSDYCLTFAFFETNKMQDAANGECSGNFFVDAIRGKDSNKPLYVNAHGKENAFCESKAVPTKAELVNSTTVRLTMSQEAQLKNANLITVNDGAVEITAENDRNSEDGTQAASVWTLKVAESLTGEVKVNLAEGAFYDAAAAEIEIAQAQIGENKYASFDAAMDAAVSGNTVIMLDDAAVTDAVFVLNTDVKLDLNGYELTVNNMMAFGQVVDSTEGEGKLVVEKTANVILLPNNEDLPMYDTDGYRFFSYELQAKGKKTVTPGSTNAYGVSVIFKDVDAYTLLAEKADTCGVVLSMDITYDGSNMNYKFQDSTLKNYASACAEVMNGEVEGKDPALYVKKTIVLTISGLNGKDISVDSVVTGGTIGCVSQSMDNNAEYSAS